MAIGVLELSCSLPLACGKQCLHLLSGVQGQAAPGRSRTGGPRGTDLTIALGKLHLNERFACILDRCPTRTDPTLWTDNPLRVPINGELREIVAGLSLIPVGLEGGANQIHTIVGLTLNKIGDRHIGRIDEMLTWEQFLLSQIGMNRGQDPLIAQGSRSSLDMGDQLWSIFNRTSG